MSSKKKKAASPARNAPHEFQRSSTSDVHCLCGLHKSHPTHKKGAAFRLQDARNAVMASKVLKGEAAPVVTQYQKEQAALEWLLERARTLSEATGLGLQDMGSWLSYQGFKDAERATYENQARTAEDRLDRQDALNQTPRHSADGELDMCREDRHEAMAWVEDVMNVGAKYDKGWDKPLVTETTTTKGKKK